MTYAQLYESIVFLFAFAMLFFLFRKVKEESESGRLRPALAVQSSALAFYVFLRLLEHCEFLPADGSALVETVASLSLALGACFGIALMHYIVTGDWKRRYYFLALLALIPEYGELIAAAYWMVIPLRLSGQAARSRDPQTIQKLHTVLLGSYGGGLFLFLAVLAHFLGNPRMLVEVFGPVASLLFIHGGLNLHLDLEHELRFPSVRIFVKLGLITAVMVAFVPAMFLHPGAYLVLERFIVPASVLIAVFFIVVLFHHFEAASIKTFLFLMVLGLLPNAFLHLYSDQVHGSYLGMVGLRLFSRTAFVLACLFILKQYLRWGFEMVQSMVMFITAISSAAIVFAVIYVLQPIEGLYPAGEYTMMNIAIYLLDAVILCSLPPILVNYRLGTMKLTWAIFTFGIFFEVLNDFTGPGTSDYERGVVLVFGYALLALAFASLWRYTNAMMQHVRQFSI